MSAITDHTNLDDASDSGDSVDAPTMEATTTSTTEAPNRYEKLERLKREKRLAMNRECARARRRRKKMRMEMLENRVQELTQKNSKVQDANDALRARVMQLESELGAARSGMAMSLSNGGPDGMPSGPPASLLGMGLSAEATQGLLAEKISLQRRLAGFGGAGSGLPAGRGGAGDQATALRYMQLMKAKSAMGDHSMNMNPFGASANFLQSGAGGDDPVGRMPTHF